MLSLQEIQQNLHSNTEVALSLNDLGTLLRDESVRADSQLASIVPFVLSNFQSEPPLVLRVLVNFTADNDNNREYLTSCDVKIAEFWTSALDLLDNDDFGHLVVVLLTQFIHNVENDKKSAMNKKLIEYGAAEAVESHIKSLQQQADVDNLALPFELLAEYSSQQPSRFTIQDVSWIIKLCRAIPSSCDQDDLDEILLYSSQTVFNITNVEDLSVPQTSVIAQAYEALANVPSELTNVAHIKRSLFSMCGNISSYPTYENIADIETNVGAIESDNADLYVMAAAAIAIGNCVSSSESQAAVLKKVNEISSVKLLFDHVLAAKFGDVVQLQALHLFNNLMTPDTAGFILDPANQQHLLRITKVVVDNSKYYQEIGAIYFKFMRKLLALGFTGGRNPLELHPVWEYLGNAEPNSGRGDVDLLILQAIAASSSAKQELSGFVGLFERLLTETLAISGTIDSQVLLAKLKTLAMVFQHFECRELHTILGQSHFHSMFASPLHNFLSEVSQSGAFTNQTAQTAAIVNNSKFVAATATTSFTTYASGDPVCADILQICSAILTH